MCAWHDALAAPLMETKGSSTVTGRKDNANRARALPEMGCSEEAWGRNHVRSEQQTGYMALRRRSSWR